MPLNNQTKIILAGLFFIASIIGFLLKLPSGFRNIDKELHTLYYFLAAAVLNILFANGKIIRHIVIFASLYLFSMGIEYVQEYSNKFFRKRIHGRYDIEDIHANLKGLIIFSFIWITYTIGTIAYKKLMQKKLTPPGN